MDDFDLCEAAHRSAFHNRGLLRVSGRAGCFHCVTLFMPGEVGQWADADTALCPECGVDAVIPSKAGFPMTVEFIEAMRRHFYS